MKRLSFLAAAALAAIFATFAVGGAGAALAQRAAPHTCTAGLTILSTSVGDVNQVGNVTFFNNSGVGGSYTSGFPAGYTFTGAQDIQRNEVTHKANLKGHYTATGPGGSFDVTYVGHADLTTGAASGHFVARGESGQLANLFWVGDIDAQLTSLTPPTFLTTNSGLCRGV
jgi:hypothetical protein